MHRFFTEEIQDGSAWIRGEDVKHIRKVLRLVPGDPVVLCDGKGTDYDAVLSEITDGGISLRVVRELPSSAEPRTEITLFQCLPKSGKLEWIIQKCTEIGVCRFVPVLSERCVVQPGDRFENRRSRYQRVAEEAAKQSRRGRIPEVDRLTPIREIRPSDFDLFILCDEEERETALKSAVRNAGRSRTVGILIGPEGGLAREEVQFIRTEGGTAVSLGPRILRTETAGMVTAAQILYEVDG